MQEKLNLFIEKIKAARSIVIMGHKNPDADSLGSMLALAKLIEMNYGTRCSCVYDGYIAECLDGIPLRTWAKYFEKIDPDTHFDLAIVVDYGAAYQIGGPLAFAQGADFVIEIDHHKNDAPIGALCMDDDTADATGVILYNIMQTAGWDYDWSVLDLIALAILTDTGVFKFARTGTPLMIMGDLVDKGVNIRRLIEMMDNKPRKAVQVEAKAVVNTEFLYRGRLALAIIDRHDYRNMDGRGELVLGLLQQIKGVEYAVLLKQQKDDKIGISIRSRGRAIDSIAASFGGGGHARAAGAVMYDSLENVRAKVIEAFKGF